MFRRLFLSAFVLVLFIAAFYSLSNRNSANRVRNMGDGGNLAKRSIMVSEKSKNNRKRDMLNSAF